MAVKSSKTTVRGRGGTWDERGYSDITGGIDGRRPDGLGGSGGRWHLRSGGIIT